MDQVAEVSVGAPIVYAYTHCPQGISTNIQPYSSPTVLYVRIPLILPAILAHLTLQSVIIIHNRGPSYYNRVTLIIRT